MRAIALLAALAVVAAPRAASAQYFSGADFGLSDGQMSGIGWAAGQGADPQAILDARDDIPDETANLIVRTILLPTLTIPYEIMMDEDAPIEQRVICGGMFYGQVILITIVVAVAAPAIAEPAAVYFGGGYVVSVTSTVVTEVGLGMGQRSILAFAQGEDVSDAALDPTDMALDGAFPLAGEVFQQAVGKAPDLFATGRANLCGKDMTTDFLENNNTWGLRLTERQRRHLADERWSRLVKDGVAHYSHTVLPSGQIVNNPPALNWNVEGSTLSDAMAHNVPGMNATSQFHDVVEANFGSGGPGYATMVPSAVVAGGALIDRYEVYTVVGFVQDVREDLGGEACTAWRPRPATNACTGGNQGMVDPPYEEPDEVSAGCALAGGGAAEPIGLAGLVALLWWRRRRGRP